MNRLVAILSVGLLLAVAPRTWASDPSETEYDDENDAMIRRTDPGADGALNPAQNLPDLLSITLSRWHIFPPTGDPFTGVASVDLGSHLFRLDMVFRGLVNPPGPIDDGALDAPFLFGPHPLLGFVEINVDRRLSNGGRDTGGDRTPDARNHFLANVGRFGGVPDSSIASRMVQRPGQTDDDFLTSPQYERSGAEFVFKLCGCETPTLVSTSVPGDHTFDAGDTWVIRGRFFERTSGFNDVSLMTCPAQQYSPEVDVRFSHNTATNRTSVSMVYATTQEGARQLAGLSSVPPINGQVGCDGNQGSIAEALADIAAGASAAAAGNWVGVDALTRAVSQGWQGRGTSLSQFLDPTDWRLTAIFGTTYSRVLANPSSDGAQFVWTDAMPSGRSGDQDGDGLINDLDRTALNSYISASDGGPMDADGIVNGAVTTPLFGIDFDLSDVTYDGRVDCRDIGQIGGASCCDADWNGDRQFGVQDLFAFLVDWFAGAADSNGDGVTSLQDLFEYLKAYFIGC